MLMTCSVYATVAVAINRYVELSPTLSLPYWLDNGKTQSCFVFFFSLVFNFPRLFELKYVHQNLERNVTREDGSFEIMNETVLAIEPTDLRKSFDYIRWYSLTINSIIMNIVPTIIMIYCSVKVYLRLKEATLKLSASDDRVKARIKRNQSITWTLSGIICMFIFCHTGKVKKPHFSLLFLEQLVSFLFLFFFFFFFLGNVFSHPMLLT